MHQKQFFFYENLFVLYWTAADYQCCAVIVSGAQQSDLAAQTPASILPQTSLPSRLPCNIEQSSMGYTGGSWLTVLNTSVCTCPSQTLHLYLPPMVRVVFLQPPASASCTKFVLYVCLSVSEKQFLFNCFPHLKLSPVYFFRVKLFSFKFSWGWGESLQNLIHFVNLFPFSPLVFCFFLLSCGSGSIGPFKC